MDSERESALMCLKKQCITPMAKTVLVITRDGRLLVFKGEFDIL